MKIASWSFVICTLAAIGCASSVSPSSGGSESHFMLPCADSSDCGSLTCTENVCTAECESTAECAELGTSVTCEELGELRACDFVCEDDEDCEGLGSSFECNSGRCRLDPPPQAHDANVIDAADPWDDIELLARSEVLGEPVELAFIASNDSDQQIWLRGTNGALRQISSWPAELDRSEGCTRFDSLSFDPSGAYLVFVERLACSNQRSRLVVHEVSTGRTAMLAEYATDFVLVSAGPRSMITSVIEGDFSEGAQLFQIDVQAMRHVPIQTPTGNVLNGIPHQIMGIDNRTELLITVGLPVLTLSDEGAQLFEPLDELVTSWQLNELGASPAGDQVCINANSQEPEMPLGRALLVTASGLSMHAIPSVDMRCFFTRDGGHAMFGTAPFEIVGDELVPLPLPSETLQTQGSYGGIFYATNDQGEVVRFDPRTGTIDVVIDLETLETACPDAPRPLFPSLYLPDDVGSVGLAHLSCNHEDLDESVSFAFDLATDAYVELDPRRDTRRELAWLNDGRALLFVPEGEAASSFYEIGPGPEVTFRTLEGVDGIVYRPATPR
jgi:hypothetical protein